MQKEKIQTYSPNDGENHGDDIYHGRIRNKSPTKQIQEMGYFSAS